MWMLRQATVKIKHISFKDPPSLHTTLAESASPNSTVRESTAPCVVSPPLKLILNPDSEQA